MTSASFALTTGLFLLVCGGVAGTAAAQSSLPLPESKPRQPRANGQNVVRLDLLAPLVANFENRSAGGGGLAFPVLASYERHLGGRWSAGVEALVRGGTAASRRSGATLLGRCYLLPGRWLEKPLQGLYASPVLSYRALSTTAGDFHRPVNRGQRAGAGLLVGWQAPLFRFIIPNLLVDCSVGVVAWTRLGPDSTNDPGYYAYTGEPIFKRTGLLPDVRYGLGYRF